MIHLQIMILDLTDPLSVACYQLTLQQHNSCLIPLKKGELDILGLKRLVSNQGLRSGPPRKNLGCDFVP